MDRLTWCQTERVGLQPDVNILKTFWKTIEGVRNLSIECSFCHPPLSNINTNLQSNHYTSNGRMHMNGSTAEDFIPLRNGDANSHRKKCYYNYDDGSSSPPHGGKKRRENSVCRRSTQRIPPWAMRNYCAGMVGLHEEIEDFYNFMRPTEEEHKMRNYVIDSVKQEVIKLWPAAKVDVFGSFQTNLYLPTSDVDIVVFGEWKNLPLFTLKQALVDNGIADESSCKVLDRAAVPIIKFQHRETMVKVDISFNMKSGVQSVDCIKSFIGKYPVLPKLIFVLKQFLLMRELNEVWTGGVSSYALILMCISFLQMHPRQDVQNPDINLGVLLMEFFELYGRHFHYPMLCIRVKNGGQYITKEQFQKQMDGGATPSLLSIEDPLTPGNDLGRGSYNIMQVKQAFDFAYRYLHTNFVQINYNSNKYQPISFLRLVVDVSEDIIEQRRIALDRWRMGLSNQILLQADGNDVPHPERCSTSSSACSSVSGSDAVNASTPSLSSSSEDSISSAESDSEGNIEIDPTLNPFPRRATCHGQEPANIIPIAKDTSGQTNIPTTTNKINITKAHKSTNSLNQSGAHQEIFRPKSAPEFGMSKRGRGSESKIYERSSSKHLSQEREVSHKTNFKGSDKKQNSKKSPVTSTKNPNNRKQPFSFQSQKSRQQKNTVR